MTSVASMVNVVSVVIPTFKRAATLDQVLPRYLLPEVCEVIVVDDCSPDHTAEIVARWTQRDARVRYLRQPANRGGPAAKNTGAAAATGKIIFIGEDDAFPLADTLNLAVAAAEREPADIVGTRTVYLMGESAEEALARPAGNHPPVDLNRLRFWFNSTWEGEVPAVHAWMLIRREVMNKVQFDPYYRGSQYREETDFCFTAGQAGCKLYFCGRAVMVHMTRQGRGGARAHSKWKYERTAVRNNWRMLRKHHAFLRQRWGLRRPAWWLQAGFALERGLRLGQFLGLRLYYLMKWYAWRMGQVLHLVPTKPG